MSSIACEVYIRCHPVDVTIYSTCYYTCITGWCSGVTAKTNPMNFTLNYYTQSRSLRTNGYYTLLFRRQGRKRNKAAYHLYRMVRKDVTITELLCSDFHGLFYTPEFTSTDHLHLCLVGRGLDRELHVTLEMFDWVYVWTLLSLRQPSVVLSCSLRPVRETPVSLSQPLWNVSTPWCLQHRQPWFHHTRKSCTSERPLHVFFNVPFTELKFLTGHFGPDSWF